MALSPTQSYLDELLGRRLVEAKIDGVPSPQLEAAAVLETISTALVFQPRAALYLAHLARNKLLAVVMAELELIDSLLQDVQDLGNPSYAVSSTQSLEQARAALLEVGGQGQLTRGGTLQRFELSVRDFLEKQVSKSVRGSVTPDAGGSHLGELAPAASSQALVRPSAEAEATLPADLESLKTRHAELLDRFYSLVVGVRNFQATPIGNILGATLAGRVQADLTTMAQQLAGGAPATQDLAVRLVAARAALRALAAPPGLADPIIDTEAGLPAGYVLSGRSPPTPATVTLPGDPVICGGARGANVSTAAGALSSARFPLPGTDLADRALVVGSEVTWPVSIPAQTHLFVSLDGTVVRVPLNDTATPLVLSLSQTLAALNAVPGLEAVELFPGAGRLAVIADTASAIEVATICVEAHPSLPAGIGTLYTRSAHAALGLTAGARGAAGVTPAQVIADSLAGVFGTLVSVTPSGTGWLVASRDSGPGAFLAPNVPGIVAGTAAGSVLFELYGTVGGDPNLAEGGSPGPVSPLGLLDPGDLVQVGGATAVVERLSGGMVQVTPALPTFDGPIVVTSALSQTWALLDQRLQALLPSWLKTKFARDLASLDAAVAPLYASSTEAARAGARSVLYDLRFWVAQLADSLSQDELPTGAASSEKDVVSGLVTTLVERKYDRALALLLKCRIREVFSLDWQSVSYSGELMSAMSEFVQADVQYPNRSRDQGMTAFAREG